MLYPEPPLSHRSTANGTSPQKRFYRVTPLQAWRNCLSEGELTPSTVKLRTEVPLALLKAAA
jgi:hypothetical protein